MKLGLAQINTTVGDLAGNQQLIATAYHQLVDQGADMVVFPRTHTMWLPSEGSPV